MLARYLDWLKDNSTATVKKQLEA